jgi:hypothetical protein
MFEVGSSTFEVQISHCLLPTAYCPLRMKKFTPGPVNPLVGMSAEIVSLGLE